MFTNKSSEVFYNKGIIHYEKGEYELSIDLFKQAIEKNSSNPQFYYNLGLAYVKTEEYDLAIDNFKTTISLNSKDADALQNLGIAYHKKSQFEEAIQSYKKAIEIKPTDYEIYDNMGISYFSMKLYKDSIECFKKALDLDKNNPALASNLGYAYYISEQYDLAKENFLYVISLNPEDEEAYFNLGNVYLKLQELNLAEENYKKTLSINPEHEEALKALNNLHKTENAPLVEEKSREIAEIEIEKVEEAKPEKEILITEAKDIDKDAVAEEYFLKAVNLLKEKNLEPAIEKLNKTLSLKQDHPHALVLLNKTKSLLNEADILFKQGVLHYSNKDYAGSIDCFKKALDIKPNSIQIKSSLAKTQIKLSLDKAAETSSPDNFSTAHYTIFSKTKEQEKYKMEVATLKKAIEENPKEPENHYNLGVVYIKQKEYLHAIDSLKTTLLLKPEHKEAQDALYDIINMINNADENSKYYYKMALIYIEKREYYKAIEELKKILALSPDNFEAKNLFSKIMIMMSKTNNQESENSNLANEIAKYQNIIATNPNDFEAYYNLGLIYSQTKNYDFAKDHLLKAINLNSNYKEAQNSLYDLIKVMNA